MKLSGDQIGDLGEIISSLELARPVTGHYRRPLFRVTRLGGKYPTADLLVDILDRRQRPLGYFWAQVKATASAEAVRSHRLPISMSPEDYNAMTRLPAPAYLIGVDVMQEASFVVWAYRTRQTRLASMSRAYNLAMDAVKIDLYLEVRAFWEAARKVRFKSRFTDVA
jgi:hypothetical protein